MPNWGEATIRALKSESARAIGAVVARFVHTEEVTGSSPVSPASENEPVERMQLVAVGGSDAGISAALRARELDPTAEVTVVVGDAYPNTEGRRDRLDRPRIATWDEQSRLGD